MHVSHWYTQSKVLQSLKKKTTNKQQTKQKTALRQNELVGKSKDLKCSHGYFLSAKQQS